MIAMGIGQGGFADVHVAHVHVHVHVAVAHSAVAHMSVVHGWQNDAAAERGGAGGARFQARFATAARFYKKNLLKVRLRCKSRGNGL